MTAVYTESVTSSSLIRTVRPRPRHVLSPLTLNPFPISSNKHPNRPRSHGLPLLCALFAASRALLSSTPSPGAFSIRDIPLGVSPIPSLYTRYPAGGVARQLFLLARHLELPRRPLAVQLLSSKGCPTRAFCAREAAFSTISWRWPLGIGPTDQSRRPTTIRGLPWWRFSHCCRTARPLGKPRSPRA